MDCREFYEQVVRLEKIQRAATHFVRVRLAEVAPYDLNKFQFDLDTTFAVFFMNADGDVYGRYGGRDATSDVSRMSLNGLRYAMEAALATHEAKNSERLIARAWNAKPLLVRNLRSGRRRGGCIHCHTAKEMVLSSKGAWNRNNAYRYPPPDNLGLTFEIDRGDIVRRVRSKSPAARAGLKTGDAVTRFNGFPVHSFADAQYALDGAPKTGAVAVSWLRNGKPMSGRIALPRGWRKTDIRWRPSMIDYLGSARVYGRDLNARERKRYGLTPKQLAFFQQNRVHVQAKAAGIRAGDIILGFDDRILDLEAYEFLRYVRGRYLIGDTVKVNLIRNGKRITRTMKLR
ncbi:MAG: Trx7/PDZ domain-containing (seleno)protein [Planctomycetaceae bacterium]